MPVQANSAPAGFQESSAATQQIECFKHSVSPRLLRGGKRFSLGPLKETRHRDGAGPAVAGLTEHGCTPHDHVEGRNSCHVVARLPVASHGPKSGAALTIILAGFRGNSRLRPPNENLLSTA